MIKATESSNIFIFFGGLTAKAISGEHEEYGIGTNNRHEGSEWKRQESSGVSAVQVVLGE
jgi:hypothetical protein